MQIRSKKFFVKTSLSVSRNSFSRVSCGGRGCWRRRKRTRRSAWRDAFTECARGHCRTKKQILFCFCLHYALFSIANVPDDCIIWPLARTVNAIEVRFLPPLPRFIKESCANNYRDVRGDRLRRKPITASAYSYACDFIDTSIWKRRNWWTSPENAKTIAQTPVLATKNEKKWNEHLKFLSPFLCCCYWNKCLPSCFLLPDQLRSEAMYFTALVWHLQKGILRNNLFVRVALHQIICFLVENYYPCCTRQRLRPVLVKPPPIWDYALPLPAVVSNSIRQP